MLNEMGEYLTSTRTYSLKKEILHAEENVRVGDILQIEQKFIKVLNAKDPRVGYNR